MYPDVELDEFIRFGRAEVRSAELNEEGLTLTREDGETLTLGRYSSINRGIPGIDEEAAATISAALGIEDSKSRNLIREVVEVNDEVTFTVTASTPRLTDMGVTAKTTWRLPR